MATISVSMAVSTTTPVQPATTRVAASDFWCGIIESTKMAEMAENAKAIKITAGPPHMIGHSGKPGSCVYCGEVATLELMFHYQQPREGDKPFEWTVLEKYCSRCAEECYPGIIVGVAR